MARYIDADKLIEALEQEEQWTGKSISTPKAN